MSARRFSSLVWTLAVSDWKLRFYGSVLGYLWQLVRPFAYFAVVYVVFTEVIDLGDQVKHYGVYILFGLVLFSFFSEVTTACVTCLVQRESLLRKVRFPRVVIPLAVVMTGLLNLAGTLVAVFVFALSSGVRPDWGWLELPLIVALLTALTAGAGMFLSVLYVRFRDVQPIWEVTTQILFYASPVLYVSSFVPDCCEEPYVAQPLAAALTELRHAVIDPSAPALSAAIGGGGRLLIPLAIVAAVLALGLWTFNREAPRIAEYL